MDKHVLAIPYDKTMDIETGFTCMKHDKNIWTKYNNNSFVLKSIATGRPELQQLVPYIVIKNTDNEYLTLELNDKLSIGLCDNILTSDGIKEPLFQCALRCLVSAVDMDIPRPLQFRGYVRDMNSNVKDCLGIVLYTQGIDKSKTKINKEYSWKSKEELIEKYARFESWSRHLINYLVDNSL